MSLLFPDPQRRERGDFGQRAGTPHSGPGVRRGRQLLGAADGAAGRHPGRSAAGAPAQRERLSWTQLQQGKRNNHVWPQQGGGGGQIFSLQLSNTPLLCCCTSEKLITTKTQT